MTLYEALGTKTWKGRRLKNLGTHQIAYVDDDEIIRWEKDDRLIHTSIVAGKRWELIREKCVACQEAKRYETTYFKYDNERGGHINRREGTPELAKHLKEHHCTCKKEAQDG